MALFLLVLACYAVFSRHAAALAKAAIGVTLYYQCATVALLACFALLLCSHTEAWYGADRRLLALLSSRFTRGRIAPRTLVIGWTSLVLALAIAGLAGHWRTIVGWRLDALQADMLPTIRLGIQRFLAGHNPYNADYWFRPPAAGVSPWKDRMVYLPSLWLPFALADLLRVGYPWVTVSAAFGVLGVFLAAALRPWRRSQSATDAAPGLAPRIALFALYATLLGLLFFLKHVASVLHTSVLWFYLALFGYFAITGSTKAASLMLGVCCAARISAVVMVPAWLIFLFREKRNSFRSEILLLLAPIVLLVAPFALANPRAFIASTVAWYVTEGGRVWRLRPDWVVNGFGLAGPLYLAGFGRWLFPIQIAGQFGVLVLAWKRVRTLRDALNYLTWALLLFYLTVAIPVDYVFSECLVLGSVVALADLGLALGVSDAPSLGAARARAG